VVIGLGFQETLSPVLSSKKNLEEKMCTSMDSIEIENVMSESYSAVRSWLLPSLMNFLSKNMHIDYPQFVFEIGECATKSTNGTDTKTKISAVIIGTNVGYQNISSVVNTLLKQLGIKHTFVKLSHSAFIEGRTASIVAQKPIGILGELHPVIINNWGLDKAVVAFELDLDELYKLYSKN